MLKELFTLFKMN